MPSEPLSSTVNPELDAVLNDRTVAARTLERYGLDLEHMETWWEIGHGQAPLPSGEPDPDAMTNEAYRAQCLTHIVQLEQWQKGSAYTLYAENYIRNFGRIPLRLLKSQIGLDLSQYTHRIDAALAAYCYSGAMHDTGLCLDDLQSKLPDDACVRIMEFGRTEEIEDVWGQTYNAGITVDVQMTAGHGDSEGILSYRRESGRGSWRYGVEKKHIRGSLGELMLGYASEEGSVVLDACSTGRGEDALAEVIHQKTGLHVIAPRHDVGMRFIRHEMRRGKLTLIPGFYTIHPQGKKVVHRRSPARHYRPTTQAA
jgi:hypothetical protein